MGSCMGEYRQALAGELRISGAGGEYRVRGQWVWEVRPRNLAAQ